MVTMNQKLRAHSENERKKVQTSRRKWGKKNLLYKKAYSKIYMCNPPQFNYQKAPIPIQLDSTLNNFQYNNALKTKNEKMGTRTSNKQPPQPAS